jgi:protein-S-isoprenylcysteine O-methyltransferase Ste14
MKAVKFHELAKRTAARGGIVLFVLVALEVMIMISPFAFFFYSVFSPFFNWLNQYAATRWLTTFFLPHMILPPTFFLQAIRVLGSVLFVAGAATFVVCALQIYLGKLFRWGVASKGLYKYIRHPQYLALGLWGVGMSILWPRFFVLVSLSIMFILYRFLARDEEARMRGRYGKAYEDYMGRTGRFFPRFIERGLAVLASGIPRPLRRAAIVQVVIIGLVIGAGFACRAITLASLPFATQANITLVPILPEDSGVSGSTLSGILRAAGEGKAGSLEASKDYLGYLMPPDYIMQGMIADMGESSHLFHHHQTAGMITDWVLHPFEHLRRPPSAEMARMNNVDPTFARRHHCPLDIRRDDLQCDHCPYRRVILVEVVRPAGQHASGSDLLSLDSVRVPVEAIDIDTRTGEIVKITEVGRTTAWKDVPTPGI